MSDSGQYNQKSRVAQGGSVQLDKNSQLNTGVQVGEKGTLTINNTGTPDNVLAGLVNTITNASSSQLSSLADSQKDTFAQFKELITERNDSEAGNPKDFSWLALAAIAALAVTFLFRR